MADSEMTYGDASNVLEAVRILEELEKRGELTRTEQVALERFRAKNPGGVSQEGAAREESIKTRSRYRGMAQGALLNGRDEITGALSALTGGDYGKARDDVRARDEAAKMLAPYEFSKGNLAGIGATAALPIGGGSALAARLGLGALPRIAIGAGEGAALTAAPQFLEGEGGFGNRMGNIDPFWTAIGAGIGGAVPAAGEMAAGAVRAGENSRRMIPGYGSKASNVMARAFDKAEKGGEDIRAYLASIGEQGMMADIPGAPRQTAQGVAAMGGAGATTLTREMNARASGSEGRINSAVDRVAGAPTRAFEQERARAAERSSTLGPLYDTAKQSPDKIDVRPITSWLVMQRENAVGDVRAQIDNLIMELGTKDGMVSAEKLHNVRSALSGTLNEAGMRRRGDIVSALSPVLQGLDQRLDTLPGYAQARGGWADSKALDDAMEDGRTVLTGGPTTVESPERFSARFVKMTDPQKEALRTGVREYIANLMGSSRNAPATAWQELAGKGFNDQKLRILFGDQEAAFILSTLKGEKTFSETRGAVLSGSQTEMRRQAANDLGDIREPDTLQRPGPISRVKTAVIDNPLNNLIDSIVYGNGRSAANAEIGKLLSLTGPERDAAVEQLLRLSKDVNVETKKQRAAKVLAETLAGTANVYMTNDQQDRR